MTANNLARDSRYVAHRVPLPQLHKRQHAQKQRGQRGDHDQPRELAWQHFPLRATLCHLAPRGAFVLDCVSGRWNGQSRGGRKENRCPFFFSVAYLG
jgi:hypothetical protein